MTYVLPLKWQDKNTSVMLKKKKKMDFFWKNTLYMKIKLMKSVLQMKLFYCRYVKDNVITHGMEFQEQLIIYFLKNTISFP